MTDRHVPISTYRLQLGPDLTLRDAAALVDHLAALGVTDLYLSPILGTPRGATHGYHITDPEHIDAELGGPEAMAHLATVAREAGVGIVLDIVPNHLAAAPDNPWWRDVLVHGPGSGADTFDIDWDAGGGRVTLPVLAAPLDEVLDAGGIAVERGGEGPELDVGGTRLPLAAQTAADAERLAGADPAAHRHELEALLDRQHYRLVWWRDAAALNYRRFFDITDLVGVRVEDPDVFAPRHERLLRLVRDDAVHGFRVDHVDGLVDPDAYLVQLRDAAATAAGWDGFYVVVEKILEGDEPLPDWPVDGTTGYEFLADVNAALADPDGLERLGVVYREVTGHDEAVVDTLHRRKLDVLHDLFPGEIDRLTHRLVELLSALPSGVRATTPQVRDALVAVTACFPVYRTYVRTLELGAQDRSLLEHTFDETRRRHPELDHGALVAVERVLSVDVPHDVPDGLRDDWLEIVLRWQQLTGPAMAKAFEDTTFYVSNRLVGLNEVGADHRGIASPQGVDHLHEAIRRRAAAWPTTMTTTSTHDTKRSEDVRARLAVLSELPDPWAALIRDVLDPPGPLDPNTAWMLWQNLVGVWPLDPTDERSLPERLHGFAEKAAREAKVHTSWLDPDEAYEQRLHAYVDGMFDDAMVDRVRAFVELVAVPGAVNALAQVAVKLTAPGVADTYQGTELWDFSLVDPDNRRPVDHGRRRRLLRDLDAAADPAALAAEVRAGWRDGRLKLLVVSRLLRARRSDPALFRDGSYEPLAVRGPHAARVVAFGRRRGGRVAVTVVPRNVASLGDPWPVGDVWDDTEVELPSDLSGTGRDLLLGTSVDLGVGHVRVAQLLDRLPVAVVAS